MTLTPAELERKKQIEEQYAARIIYYNRAVKPETAMKIAKAILEWSVFFKIDARFVMALIKNESNFNVNAVSSAGAKGLGQLIAATARAMGVTKIFDIYDNVKGAVAYLIHIEKILVKKGVPVTKELILAGYNAGPYNDYVIKGKIPPYKETKAYVNRVIATYKELTG